MYGIILAGGRATRLGELTKVTNKHLLPVGNLPMIYHPIKKLAGIGVQDILVVSGTDHMGDFVELLGSGKKFGVDLTYKVQDEAGGIAQALGLAKHFCCNGRCIVLLGDNIFYSDLGFHSEESNRNNARIFLKEVPDPQRYGVAKIVNNRVVEIVEKPHNPQSNYAVAGIYIYPNNVFDVIKTLKPSRRGELEITDVNNYYLHEGKLDHSLLDGYWTDAGTLESLALANKLVNENGCQY